MLNENYSYFFFIFNLCMLKSSVMCVYVIVIKITFQNGFLLENVSKYYIYFLFLKFNFDTSTSKHDKKILKKLN
jgi:hypothetical protein